MVTVAQFIDSIEHLTAGGKAALKRHVQMDEFGAKLDADCEELFKEALHENLPATFNALERTAVKRILKHHGAAEGQRAFSFHVASPDEDIDLVDAETNEIPVRSFKVSRNHQGKLYLDRIEKALANRGLVLLGIGEDVNPAHKDGWTTRAFNTSPVQLVVGPKPGVRFKQAIAYPTQQTFLKQIWQAIVA
ncbi:hypothetical protein ABBQ38_014175 [Trebouxia sp. C0009 RCD-2024]